MRRDSALKRGLRIPPMPGGKMFPVLRRLENERVFYHDAFWAINETVYLDKELPPCAIFRTALGRNIHGFFSTACQPCMILLSPELTCEQSLIVLLHEMIHYDFYLRDFKPKDAHGIEFQRELVRAGVLDEHAFRIARGSPIEAALEKLSYHWWEHLTGEIQFSRVVRGPWD